MAEVEDQAYFCSMCAFNTFSSEHLLKHTIRDHKNDPNFRVHCSLCGASFEKWNYFQRHVRRKHAEEYNGDDFLRTGSEDNGNNNLEQEIANDIPELCNVNHEKLCSYNDKMQWNAAKYILTLKEKHRLTQRAVDATMEATKELVNQVVEVVKQKVIEKMTVHRINVDQIIQDEEVFNSSCGDSNASIFDTSFLFEQLDSQYLQTKFFTEKFNLVVS